MLSALEARGFHGVGINELLVAAQAPKGVLYHHFPGGKSELAVAAIEAAISNLTARLDQAIATRTEPVVAVRILMASAERRLERSGYSCGCALATISLESTTEDTAIRAALADGFMAIRSRLETLLMSRGIPKDRAQRLSALIVASYEGALIQSRVAETPRFMRLITEALVDQVKAEQIRADK